MTHADDVADDARAGAVDETAHAHDKVKRVACERSVGRTHTSQSWKRSLPSPYLFDFDIFSEKTDLLFFF